MKVLFWIAGVLTVANLIPAAFFYVLFLGSGEPVPRQRAVMFWRWAVLVVLFTVNIVIFRRVYLAFVELFTK